ncbi:uncharacterized protein DUF397 [Streptomyces sp. Ag109_O5-1]|nr:uncharacterized protein DUF397 [Streptomyces sp. Ag109_O5-1]
MASSRIDLSDEFWFKSSYSNGDGGDCVEVAGGFSGAALWRKSSYWVQIVPKRWPLPADGRAISPKPLDASGRTVAYQDF